jgi:hypothetical protein
MKAIHILTLSLLFCLIACKSKNHIEKYGLKIENLNKLPDNFYAYRRGSIFIDNGQNLIWFNLNNFGNIKELREIWVSNKSVNHNRIYTQKDTINLMENAQEFINLSRKYRFGHMNINRKNKISFSYRDGLSEQFVKALSDSVKTLYLNNNDFKLLENGWFENKNK